MAEETDNDKSFLSKIGDMFFSFLKRFGLIISSVFAIFVSFIFIKKLNHEAQIRDNKKKEDVKNNLETVETELEEAKQETSEIKEEIKEEINKTEEKIEKTETEYNDYVKEQQDTAKKAGFKKKNKINKVDLL